MPNYNYGSRYPIHNYGSDKIRGGVQRWIQGKAQKQAAMLEAISETLPYMKDFSPGSPAWEKMEDAFGGQVTRAMATKANAEKGRMATQNRITHYEIGNKYLAGADEFIKMWGDESYQRPEFKTIMKGAEQAYAKAGVNFKYNSLIDYKENMENLKKESTGALLKAQEQVLSAKQITPEMLKGLEAGVAKYTASKYHSKEVAGTVSKSIEAQRKILAAKETERHKRESKKQANQRKIETEERVRMNKPATTAGMEADAIKRWREGVPFGQLTDFGQAAVNKYLKSTKATETDFERMYQQWISKTGNKDKTRDDLKKELRQVPTYQLNKLPAEKLPAEKYNNQILNQVGFMRSESQKLVDKKIQSNPKLKYDLAQGEVTNQQLVVTEMRPWVIAKHPEAILYDLEGGRRVWVIPREDGTGEIIADETGWVQ